MSPTHLHSDPIQVFDVEQHQAQDPVGHGKGFQQEPLLSVCMPQFPSSHRLSGHLRSPPPFLVPGLSLRSLHTPHPPHPLFPSDS